MSSLSIKAQIAVVLFALGLVVGWGVNGWRSEARIQSLRADHAKVLADISAAMEKTRQAVQRAADAANAAINEADKAATERITQNEQEVDRLRACVRAGTCGVRIVTRVVRDAGSAGAKDSAASAMGDAGVELDSEVQQRILDLRAAIQRDAEIINYLQPYAESCWRAGRQISTFEE